MSSGPSLSVGAHRLAGKTALITGATSGIGKATALLLAQSGVKLVLTGRREALLTQVVKEVNAVSPAALCIGIPLDMQNSHAVQSLLSSLPKELGEIDILVSNAGLASGTDEVSEIKQSDLETMFATNVVGMIQLTQLVLKQMKRRSSGQNPYPGGSVYCASKAAVHAFAESALKELISTSIRVSVVEPGMVETEFSLVRFNGDSSAAQKVYDQVEPLTAVDIAEEICWILSRPNHINIAELYVLPTCQGGSGSYVHRGPFV